MASIDRIRRGVWRVRWREDGKNRSSPLFDSKEKAQEFALQMAARVSARKAPDGLPLTGRELAEHWREHLRRSGRSERYIEMAPALAAESLGETTLSRLSPAALRSLGIGRRRAVQAALRWGARELGASVPPACLRLPCSTPGRRAAPDLMPDDVVAMIQSAADALSPSMGAIVHLVSVYGHRPESLAHLTRDAVEAGHITLVVKGGDTIRHPILPETVMRLKAAPLPFVSPRTGKAFVSGHEISALYRSAIGRSRWKAETGIYALKRRAISRMLGLGLDAATVASITGHRRPDVLLRHYARTNEARQVAALAALSHGTE